MRSKTAKLLTVLVVALSFFNLVAPAMAQEQTKQAPKADKDKRKTKIDFEDELVEGEVKKPELFYLLQKKQFNFKRLIRLRENFVPEMRRDADEIRRGRGKN